MTTSSGGKMDLVKKCNQEVRRRKGTPTWPSARGGGVAGKEESKWKRNVTHPTQQGICSPSVHASFLLQCGWRVNTGPDRHTATAAAAAAATAAAAAHTPLVAAALESYSLIATVEKECHRQKHLNGSRRAVTCADLNVPVSSPAALC